MQYIGIAMLLAASLCCAQDSGGFQPATTNLPDAPAGHAA